VGKLLTIASLVTMLAIFASNAEKNKISRITMNRTTNRIGLTEDQVELLNDCPDLPIPGPLARYYRPQSRN
jgi:hypothetical protein